MLWLKALHIIAVICWFAGIFYLPRILVYYAASKHPETREQLAVMARKLYRFMTPIAVIAVALGVALVLQNTGWYLSQLWLQLKLLCVLALIVFHAVCGVYVGRVQRGENDKTHVFYRVFNEIPVIFLLLIVCLAVLRPA